MAMMPRLALVLFAAAVGCGSIDPRAGLHSVQDEVQRRGGCSVAWNQSSADDQAVSREVDRLLQGELSSDAAVQIALLNNRRLQGRFEDLGIAQAELVQAGLLRNPVFSASVRFGAGGGNPDLEFGVTQQFMELLTLSLRKKVAQANMLRTEAEVAGAVLELAADARRAYWELQAAKQTEQMRQTVLELTQAGADLASRLREAGNIRQLDLALQQALAQQSQLDLSEASGRTQQARDRLLLVMGFSAGPPSVRVPDRLPEIPRQALQLDALRRSALENRLDLVAERQRAAAAATMAGIADVQPWLDGVSVGADTQRDIDQPWKTGPQATIPIPLFDQGQASRAQAAARLRQARQQYLATQCQITWEVNSAYTRMQTAAAQAKRYHDVLLPLRRKITAETQLQYNAMQVGTLQLLQAKREEIQAAQGYVDALKEYWLARADLEKAMGTRLPQSTASPATAPARGRTTADSTTQPAPGGMPPGMKMGD